MLFLFLALATSPQAPDALIDSLQRLDALCDRKAFDGPVALPLDYGSFDFVPADAFEGEPFVQAPRPLRALDGQVAIHLVDRAPLAWTGSLDEASARLLLSRNEAKATVVGHLERASDFPTCSGHRQTDHRVVSLRLEALYIFGESGQPLGRYAEPKPTPSKITPGVQAEVQVRCGVPCATDSSALEAARSAIRPLVAGCVAGAPPGKLAFELAIRRGEVSIRGALSTLPSRIASCVRDAVQNWRVPVTDEESVLLLDVEVITVGVSTDSEI